MKSFAVLAAIAPMAFAQNLCGQYQSSNSNGYLFNNNMWGMKGNDGQQCTKVDKTGDSVAFSVDWTWHGDINNVKSYPNVGREIENKPLVKDIGSMPTAANWKYTGDVRADVAYDLFTASDPNHDESSGDFELMIWLGKLGNIYPIGESTGTVELAGHQWELHDGMNGDMHVYSFVATNQVNDFKGDVKDFYDHLAQNKGFPAESQHLLTMQFGTEPFSGGPATFTVNNWSGSVQ